MSPSGGPHHLLGSGVISDSCRSSPPPFALLRGLLALVPCVGLCPCAGSLCCSCFSS